MSAEGTEAKCSCSAVSNLAVFQDIQSQKVCPWLYFHKTVTSHHEEQPLFNRRSSSQTKTYGLSAYFEGYLEYLRWRGSEEQAEELEMFVEMLSWSGVFWRYEADGNISIRTTLTSGRDERYSELDVMFTLPQRYPDPGFSVDVTVLGGDSSATFLLHAAEELQSLATVMAESGAPILNALISAGIELVAACPETVKSNTRGVCPACTREMRRAKVNPTPVPVKREEVGWTCINCGGPAYFIPNLVYVDFKTRNPILPDHAAVLQPYTSAVECCSFCFDDEVSSYVSLSCGCWTCLSCFNTLCEVAIGERKFVQTSFPTRSQYPYPGSAASKTRLEYLSCPKYTHEEENVIIYGKESYPFVSSEYRFGGQTRILGVGIPCPNHTKDIRALRRAQEEANVDEEGNLVRQTLDQLLAPSNMEQWVIFSPLLFSLLPTRTMRLYNFLSMEYALNSVQGAFICPLPTCKSTPYLSSHSGSHPYCPYCGHFFCLECKKTNCECGKGGVLQETNVLANPYILKAFAAKEKPKWKPEIDVGCATVSVFAVLHVDQYTVELPLDGNWYIRLNDYILENAFYLPGKVGPLFKEELFMCVFQGVLLDPTLSLRDQFVYGGAIIFLVPAFTLGGNVGSILRYLEKIGSSVAVEAKGGREDESKICPICTKPVVHYINHGCHIIYSCHANEAQAEWCYVCRSISHQHQCPKHCPLFCKYTATVENGKISVKTDGCSCPLCSTCKPMRPCAQCMGCPACDLRVKK
ncbi:hypothetical protein AGDE_16176 [Angomonas deanei]|nr:hypothetical protein AGDE_16176 [Angomonas deanei]|eukprot:EPY17598.1 hypothetical protein AGDE_16176 [Angomonas deanei]